MFRRSLLDIADLSADEITHVLDTAQGFVEISRRTIKKVPSLRGRTILNVFLEPSTRTRVSFELAAKRLSADAVNLSGAGSSVSKGESLQDTAQTLQAMRADLVVLRHGMSGAGSFVAKKLAIPVLNAGDGRHAHPTQALLDLLTVRQRFGTLEGLQITVVGDIAHSRVARSAFCAFTKMGCSVTACGPATLIPRDLEQAFSCTLAPPHQAFEGAQVIMALRLQQERMTEGALPDLREYASTYGVNPSVLSRAHPDVLVLHPGPINRGVEIAAEIADGAQSGILTQVENGVAVRMAVLYLVLAGEPT